MINGLLMLLTCECGPQMRGGKVLVIDPQFAGPLGLITEIQLLKARRSPT